MAGSDGDGKYTAIDYLLYSFPEFAIRIQAWNEFMHRNFDYETGLFPSQQNRQWADQEYVAVARQMGAHGFTNVHVDMWW